MPTELDLKPKPVIFDWIKWSVKINCDITS